MFLELALLNLDLLKKIPDVFKGFTEQRKDRAPEGLRQSSCGPQADKEPALLQKSNWSYIKQIITDCLTPHTSVLGT